jgi:glutamyl/glutaminyl-tRNA synthetase
MLGVMQSQADNKPLVTRFAPSPTGHLHVGGARTALFCWAFARRHGGRFMIRIEDTDQARSSDESARGILDDLAWLGVAWDDGPVLGELGRASRAVGPYFQAQRLAIYNAYIEHLVRLGHAYPAFETGEELDAQRRTMVSAKQTYRYVRPADVTPGVFNAARWARAQGGERHVVRFVMPPGEVVVRDQILGDVRIAPGEVDDFVVRKADGFPTYHFAVVIDDELMGVTHVLRAQEHLINTPKHVALQGALTRLADDRDARSSRADAPRFRTPTYAHLPLIFSADGGKMSKRDKAKAARKHLKDLLARDKALSAQSIAQRTGLEAGAIESFLAADTDAVEIAQAVARAYGLHLPEIDVWDYRASGYLPEVLVNYLALLGWSSGHKNPDGTDVDRFDLAFLANNFALERVGKKEARFDRAKLLAFNADALQRLSDEDFLNRWLAWLAIYEPDLHTAVGGAHDGPTPFAHQQLLWMVQAVRPRAKTLADGHKPVAPLLRPIGELRIDPASAAKVLHAPAALAKDAQAPAPGAPRLSGQDVLRALRPALAAHADWSPVAVDALLAQQASALALPLGSVAQPLRVALTGTTVSPGLGHCCAILGREATLARIDHALAHRPDGAPAGGAGA